MYFQYGEKEVAYLKSRDHDLAKVIDRLGHLDRPVNHDLFSALVYHMIGQQISTKAHHTIWQRMNDVLGNIDAKSLLEAGRDRIQSFGLTFRKTDHILNLAQKVNDHEIQLEAFPYQSDEVIIQTLTALPGIGIWTAQMLLLHGLERKDVLSYHDLAILRGMRLVYQCPKIDKPQFDKYRARLSPYGSVASIYFWAVASESKGK